MMNYSCPPSLLDLAIHRLLQDEDSLLDSLENVPNQLFPSLFMGAVQGRHCKVVKSMVQTWPFPCLPFGALVQDQQPHRDIFEAALEGVEALLAQRVCPRSCKLQVLDLRENIPVNFWKVWSQSGQDTDGTPPKGKRRKTDDSRPGEQETKAHVEVHLELCLRKASISQPLWFLLRRVSQSHGLLRLCCSKLVFLAMPPQSRIIGKILNSLQLDCVQDLAVYCNWELFSLVNFAPLLGHVVYLRRLSLHGIILNTTIAKSEEERETLITQFTSQLVHLQHLQELDLDSILFLKGHLQHILRYLRTPLEKLRINDCSLWEADLENLSRCDSISQLRSLHLSVLELGDFNPECLKVVLERASGTLHSLDLGGCEITDAQLIALLPILGRCSKLSLLNLGGNPVSMASLKSLLQHTLPLRHLQCLDCPIPVECYEDDDENLHLGTLEECLAQLRLMVLDLGHHPAAIHRHRNPSGECESIVLTLKK